MKKYDLIVIGSGPAGEKAAVKAAYFKIKVAIVERAASFGGTPVYEGIPAKVLQEGALSLCRNEEWLSSSGLQKLRKSIPIGEFIHRCDELSLKYSLDVKENLVQHGVDIYVGEAAFDDPHHVHIFGQRECIIYGEYIIVAVGTQAASRVGGDLPIDGRRVHNSKTILGISQMPRSLCIVGMGIVGCEYSSIFSQLGIKIFFINKSRRLLSLFDTDVVDYFVQAYQARGVEFMFEDEVTGIEVPEKESDDLRVFLRSEEILHVDMLMHAGGRRGNTQNLRLDRAGVEVDSKNNIPCNDDYQTNVAHIYAVGDVNSKIALANAAMDQGRAAVSHLLKHQRVGDHPAAIPYGVYAIPEIASVGPKEEELQKLRADYGVGFSYYGDLPRGKLAGSLGFMKILFTKDDGVIQGVQIVGSLATELIHYGVELVAEKKTLWDASNQLFNFPTLHELYKYAAYDGLSLLQGYKMKKRSHHT